VSGGRVLTFRDWIPGKSIEGGGEIIGSNHPTWLALAKTFNLTFRPVSDDDVSKRPVILNGELLDETKKRALFEDLDRVLGTLTDQAIAVDADRPWLSPGAMKSTLVASAHSSISSRPISSHSPL
jgi:monoamine oxidase